ncbi:tetratricopeptide repeat protein [Gemmatimonadota bacterium]
MASKISRFLSELKRRKVYHVAVAYLVVGLGVIEGADLVQPTFEFSQRVLDILVFLVVLGFPLALALAWVFEVKRETPPNDVPTAPRPESAGDGRKSIVVLPFDNLSPDPGDVYFSDGLTEETIANLSHIRSLRVISRSSAMVYRGTQKDVRTIGAELDIQYVLEGSVRKAGDKLRITAQLIDAVSDEHLWAEKYDGVLGDVFDIQERVSRSIVDALRVSLAPEEEQRLAERPLEDIQAYELYLMARRETFLGTAESLERARLHLEKGLELFGENIVLLQGLAEMYLHRYEAGIKADDETLGLAKGLSARIVALQPDSAYAHYLNGRIERFLGTNVHAALHWERAVAADPGHSSSVIFLFHTYGLLLGKLDQAAAMKRWVLELDPLNAISWLSVGWYHWMRGELEETRAVYQRIREIAGPTPWESTFSAYLMVWEGRKTEALSLLDDQIERDEQELHTEWAILLRQAIIGESVGDSLSETTREFLWNDPEAVWLAAGAFALGGRKEEALDWIEHAVARGWINYPLLSQDDPLLESLRSEPRYTELMRRVKREWEAFKPNLRIPS